MLNSVFEECILLSDMDYLDALSEGLQRVLLVRGSGQEVVTIYS